MKQRERNAGGGITERLQERIFGQDDAMQTIVPFIEMYQAGLAPEGRPAGIFLLLGPTGTGKTRTVEALAEVLHGSDKNVLRVDCGEYQMDHEVAKLIGAPPGYLGHRETQPLFNQQKVNAVASPHSSLSLVLFDEIEKAAPSLTRLLLGVLDKGTLRLGDNNVVNFDRSLIFLTSNVGAQTMMQRCEKSFGLAAALPQPGFSKQNLQHVTQAAARKQFAPEFLNRIDAAITYHPLSKDALREILDQQLYKLQEHLWQRLGAKGFLFSLSDGSREFLLTRGTSAAYGARELKRVVQRHLAQPLGSLVSTGPRSAGHDRARARGDRRREPQVCCLAGTADGRKPGLVGTGTLFFFGDFYANSEA